MKSVYSSTTTQAIIGDASQNSTVGFIFMYRYPDSSGTLICNYANGTVASIGFGNIFTGLDNQWMHIVVVYGFTNKTITVYRNGVRFGLVLVLSGTPVFPSVNRAKYIGSYAATMHRITDGSLDEVRIYNRGLSAEEVAQHYNSTKSKFGL
jgi:hypothetical protein